MKNIASSYDRSVKSSLSDIHTARGFFNPYLAADLQEVLDRQAPIQTLSTEH